MYTEIFQIKERYVTRNSTDSDLVEDYLEEYAIREKYSHHMKQQEAKLRVLQEKLNTLEIDTECIRKRLAIESMQQIVERMLKSTSRARLEIEHLKNDFVQDVESEKCVL